MLHSNSSTWWQNAQPWYSRLPLHFHQLSHRPCNWNTLHNDLLLQSLTNFGIEKNGQKWFRCGMRWNYWHGKTDVPTFKGISSKGPPAMVLRTAIKWPSTSVAWEEASEGAGDGAETAFGVSGPSSLRLMVEIGSKWDWKPPASSNLIMCCPCSTATHQGSDFRTQELSGPEYVLIYNRNNEVRWSLCKSWHPVDKIPWR